MTQPPSIRAAFQPSRRGVISAALGVAGALALPATTAWAAETGTGLRAPGIAADASLVIRWNQATMDAILAKYRANGTPFGPATVNARALAIVHNCIYDAWACYDRTAVGTRFGGTLRRPLWERTLSHKNEALSYAAHRALVALFPDQRAAADSMLSSLGYDPAISSPSPNSPAWIGLRTAQAVLDFRPRTAPTSWAPRPTRTPPATSPSMPPSRQAASTRPWSPTPHTGPR